MTIELNVATVIYIFSCITIVGGAIKVLWSAKKALLKPLEDVNKKLEDHDKFLANDKTHLEKIDYVLSDLNESFGMMVKSQKVILGHLRDGNHTGEIQKAEDELDTWLVSKVYK